MNFWKIFISKQKAASTAKMCVISDKKKSFVYILHQFLFMPFFFWKFSVIFLFIIVHNQTVANQRTPNSTKQYHKNCLPFNLTIFLIFFLHTTHSAHKPTNTHSAHTLKRAQTTTKMLMLTEPYRKATNEKKIIFHII